MVSTGRACALMAVKVRHNPVRMFVPGWPEEEEWVDVDDAGKSMEGSCASAEAGCCSHEAHTNTEAGETMLWQHRPRYI